MQQGRDIVMNKLMEEGMSLYQLAKALGYSRQNVWALLGGKNGEKGDIKFDTVARALGTLGYELELKKIPYCVVSRKYLDHIVKKGRPPRLFIAEDKAGYYAVDNRSGGCYFIAFDQKETKEENKEMFEKWLEKAT